MFQSLIDIDFIQQGDTEAVSSPVVLPKEEKTITVDLVKILMSVLVII